MEAQLFENRLVVLSELRTGQPVSANGLDQGAVRCSALHLSEWRHFLGVVTSNATFVIHGTTFYVAVEPTAGSNQTYVRVEEGVVTVTGAVGEACLEASQSWGCDAQEDQPQRVLPTPTSRQIVRSASEDQQRRAAFRGCALSEQNRLFQPELAAELNGDTHAAAALSDLLPSHYPKSPLADDARVIFVRVGAGAKGGPNRRTQVDLERGC